MSLSQRLKISSIILAGGQGTRLFPLTLHRCKPAVVFAGRYRLIDVPISNSYHAGIRDIYILTQYLSSSIHNHILCAYHPDFYEEGYIHLLSGEESPSGEKTYYQGTADAVRKNLMNFPDDRDYFFILSGDQLYSMELERVLDFAVKKNADLVVCTIQVPEAEAKRMGIMKTDGDHKITHFCEKPQETHQLNSLSIESKKDHYLGSMGIYLFKKSYLEEILKSPGHDFGKDIIPLAVKQNRAHAFIFDGYWEDIGTVESYYKAHYTLMDEREKTGLLSSMQPIFTLMESAPSPLIEESEILHSMIAAGCHIRAKSIIRSVVGLGVFIGKDSIIEDTIILGSHPWQFQNPKQLSSIGEGCILKKCILDEMVRLPSNVQLINKDQIKHFDGDGIFIRNGIIIVTEKANIPSGYIL